MANDESKDPRLHFRFVTVHGLSRSHQGAFKELLLFFRTTSVRTKSGAPCLDSETWESNELSSSIQASVHTYAIIDTTISTGLTQSPRA